MLSNPKRDSKTLRGASDVWDRSAGAVFSWEFFTTGASPPNVLNIAVRSFSVQREAFKSTYGVSTQPRSVQCSARNVSLFNPTVQLNVLSASVPCAGSPQKSRLSYRVQSGLCGTARPAVRTTLRVRSAVSNVGVVPKAVHQVLNARALQSVVLASTQEVTLLEIAPLVMFEVARYVFGVQGAPVGVGLDSTQGAVVPRSTLQLWLWQNGEEVLAQRGAVCILRSGTVVFIVG